MKLVIIEGIGKKDTIKKYLGSGYEVMATGGVFRDLQKRALSVDVDDNYTPKYKVVKDKEEVVKKLKEKAAKADEVLIATDPDREGEAIGWHLAVVLGIKADQAKRIVFNEITKSAIQKAIASPQTLNMDLVKAQQARRILDRLVGYKLSPVVSKKINKSKLSAGRVQSVTLKLVVLREREIINFKPEEFWDFFAHLEKDKVEFRASLHNGLDGKRIKLTSKEQVDTVVAGVNGAKYTVKDVRKSVTRQHAPAPYVTSSMQQDALNKAGLSLARCGRAAQSLYEGVNVGERGKIALVTYIRTDSFRVAPEAQYAAKDFIIKTFGPEYAPEKFNFYKSKKSAQDAHEAIRPVSIEVTPDEVDKYVERDQAKLYRLIYNRFLASQMTEATFNSVSVDIDANNYMFRATGRTPIFAGWQAAHGVVVGVEKPKAKKDDDEENTEKEEFVKLPELEVGNLLKFLKLEFAQKFTKPPARFTEATLVKAMEEAGIGRPATYNPIIQNIAARFYTEKDGKYIKPTELGFIIVDLLDKYFVEIMNVEFTAGLEERLDDIAYEGLDWVKVIDDFYKPFMKDIEVALEGEDDIKLTLEESDIECEKCGKFLVVRQGRFGKFLACPGFPDCRNIKPFEKPVCKCPKCQGDIHKRKSKKGRIFFGCSSYPNCDFVAWDEPTGVLCEKCGGAIVVAGKEKKEKCGNRECGK
ncbi:MAG: type I DNA topoisomerase [Firmicutes bacterium]|nr:type I DNA topoisomerase [Bacillota bacterium]